MSSVLLTMNGRLQLTDDIVLLLHRNTTTKSMAMTNLLFVLFVVVLQCSNSTVSSVNHL